MPSSPKIPKDVILKNALEMLIKDGYASITIKSLAEKIGCSTQPISWHFRGMENFRAALTEYALDYANAKMRPESNGKHAFAEVGFSYLCLAFDEPKLFRYLYMSGESGYTGGGLEFLFQESGNAELIKQIAKESGLSVRKIRAYFTNTLVYTHGLACFIASGLLKITKQQAKKMMNEAANQFWSEIKN